VTIFEEHQAFYAAKSVILSDADGNFNRVKDILNAWSPTNTSSNIPRLSMNDPNSNFSTAPIMVYIFS